MTLVRPLLVLLLFLVAGLCRGQNDIENGLVLYCPFTNSVEDIGPFKNTLVPNSITYNKGIDGAGISFNGNNSYLDILNHPSLNFGESDFTYSFWLEFFYLPDRYASIVSKVEETQFPFRGLSFFAGELDGQHNVSFRTSGEFPLLTSSNGLANGTWKHVVLIRRQGSLEVYIDKELIGNSSLSSNDVSNNANIRFGANYEAPDTQRYNGGLDELRIYNRALSKSEISQLYGSGGISAVIYWTIAAVLVAGMMTFFSRRHKRQGLLFDLDTITSVGTGLKISFSMFYGFVLYAIISSMTITFSDRAFFGGDTWEYQSMAVNFAKGHGIQKFGQLERFEDYKFDRQDENLMKPFDAASYDGNIGVNNFYRTPAYPLFIGIIYKIFGVHPLIAKQIQLLMLVLIASFLPWIGAYFWGRSGFWSGFVAGAIYIAIYYDMAASILTESLITFSVFLIILAFINFDTKKTWLSAVLLGVSLGFSVLVKGSLIFLPFLLGLGILWQAYKQKSLDILKRLVVVGASTIVTVLPWSIYASTTDGRLIVLSTQGEAVMLDGNNEYSKDGGWHPEWQRNDNHYYKSETIKNLPLPVKVTKFYLSHRDLVPEIFRLKLTNAFNPFLGLWVILFLVIIDYWSRKIERFTNKFIYIIFMLASLLGLLMIVILPYIQHTADKLFTFSRNNLKDNGVFYVVLLVTLLAVAIDRKARLAIKFPFILMMIFLNFLLLTLIAFGDPRFVGVMDFIFLLCGVQYLVLMLRSFYARGSERSDVAISDTQF